MPDSISIMSTNNASVDILNTTVVLTGHVTFTFKGNRTRILSSNFLGPGWFNGYYTFGGSSIEINKSIIYLTAGGQSACATSFAFFNATSTIIVNSSTLTYASCTDASVRFTNNSNTSFINSFVNRIRIIASGVESYNMTNISSIVTGSIQGPSQRHNFINSTVSVFSITLSETASLRSTNTNSTFTASLNGTSYLALTTSNFSTLSAVQNSSIELVNSTLINDGSDYLSFTGNKTTIRQSKLHSYRPTTMIFGGSTIEVNQTYIATNKGGYGYGSEHIYDASSILILDSTIDRSSDVGANSFSSTVNFTNVTWSGTKSFSQNGTLWDKNWLILSVKDSIGKYLLYADVLVTNNASEIDLSTVTESNGFVQIGLTNYKQNATAQYNYTQTVNISVVGGEAQNIMMYNMTTTRYLNVTFLDIFNYVFGAFSAKNFNANVTITGNDLNYIKPYNGTRQVRIKEGAVLYANFSWNFSADNFSLANITVTRSTDDHYVGINGTSRNVTVWVPLWGNDCNVKTCAGKANISHCSSGDWISVSSARNGSYCVLTVNGTVAQDGPTAITTTVRIRVPGWDFALVAILFLLAFVIFIFKTTKK
jgi:hypothetical protein